MVHAFSCTQSFDISSVEGYVINNICENEEDKIQNVQLPVEGSYTFYYSKLVSLINKLQDKDNISASEIDNIYNEGKKILKNYGYDRNSHIKTLAEELELLYLSLKKDINNDKWKDFKNSKINQLNLRFNYTKANETKILTEKKYSSKLDSKLVDKDEVLLSTLNEYKRNNNTNGNGILNFFNYEALAWVSANSDINLSNIYYRFPNVFKLGNKDNSKTLLKNIIEDNNRNTNRGSDKFERITLDQMNEIYKLDSQICNSPSYINYYLKKILPSEPKELKIDSKEFKQLEDFAKMVSNSNYQTDLKYLILHLKLKNAIIQKLSYDENDFISYLKLPYYSSFIRIGSLRIRKEPRNNQRALFIDGPFAQEVEDDDSIIKIYLTYLFQKSDKLNVKSWKKYSEYLNEYDLKRLFVEARLTKYPNELQEIKKNFEDAVSPSFIDKVELEFEKFTNPIKQNRKSEETTFRLTLKNINNLYVKEYEINSLAVCKENDENEDNFYLKFDLSGLLPFRETSYTYNKNPLERWVEEFKFKYNKRCVYIIEFIGKELACRAIVRNGDLRFIEKKEIYGQVIHIIDEDNNFVTGKDYGIWYGNNIIKANEDGEFIIPYGNKRNNSHIIITDGTFAKKYDFTHQQEEYSCDVNFVLNSEAITMGNKANLIVRVAPKLLYDIPVPCELIEDGELNITITSIDNISIDKSFTDIKFKSDSDSSFEFTVPENVSTIMATLKGSIKISSQSGNKKFEINRSQSFEFNSIDKSNEITDINLKKNSSGYYLIVLGKNGERISNYVVELELRHIFVSHLIKATLQTDDNGIIELGPLEYIKELVCNINKYRKNWSLIPNYFGFPNRIVISEGEDINIAYPYNIYDIESFPNLWGLFMISPTNKISIIKDLSSNVKFNKDSNIINIKNLTAGIYTLQLDYPSENNNIEIIVGKEEKIQHVTKLVVGEDNYLYYKLNNKEESNPLQITTENDGENLILKLLSNDYSTLRVHAILSNFIPNQSYYNNFHIYNNYPINQTQFFDIEYLYNESIQISKEKIYIQSRKLNKNSIGNMLRKPTTILVPLESKKATEEKRDMFDGGLVNESIGINRQMKKKMMAMKNCVADSCGCGFGGAGSNLSSYTFNYNFLSHPGKCLCNLIPDENGIIKIPLNSIDDDYSYIEIIAINSYGMINKVINDAKIITTMDQSVTDISMASKFEKDKYYTEKREIATVVSGKSLEILASSGTKVTTIESIAKVLSLAAIINPDIASDINEFAPILTKWESLNFKEKSQKYSTHICNELNLFIYFKDKEFFNQVISPFIKSKLIKCFIDKWLLNEDLMDYIEDSKKFNSLNDFEIILLYFTYKSNNVIAEKLRNHLNNEIDRMEKKSKSYANEIKKIFDTIIENGEEIEREEEEEFEEGANDDEADDDDDDDIGDHLEEVECEEESFEMDGLKESKLSSINFETKSAINDLSFSRPQRLMRMAAPAMAPMVGMSFSTQSARPFAPMASNSLNMNNMAKLTAMEKKVKKEGPMFYEEIEKTTIWNETGNWKSPISETVSIEMNPFWKDVYESSDSQGKVLSKNFINIINKSFTELIFACALMDLPLISKDNQDVTINSQIYKINTKSNIIVLYKQLMESEFKKNDAIFCLRSYFDPEKEELTKNDEDENGAKVNPTDFEPGKVYGCEIIITNVSLGTKYLDILYQIPNGSICVNSGKKTSIEQIKLNKYSSTNIRFYFYFPKIGKYKHCPVYISHKERNVIAISPETSITVSIKNNENKVFESWVDIANFGKNEDVLKWLKDNPTSTKQLHQVYWRLKDKSFFDSIIELYKTNCEYDDVLWSYGLYHDNIDISIEYLLNNKSYLKYYQFIYFICNKIIIDKIESKEFTLLDYYPLINKRVHKLPEKNGSKMISNKELSDYYDDFLVYLFHKSINIYTSRDYLQLICCLLLQDRVSDALIIFKIFEKKYMNNNIRNANSINGLIQRDYIASYLDFYNEKYIDEHANKKLKIARERSMKYDNYPIKNWNNMFSEIIQSIKYLDDNGEAVNIDDLEDKDNTTLKVNNIIDNTPSLSMTIINEAIHIKYKNLTHCKICYYPVDFEMQFSIQPFIISENKNNQNDEKKKSNVTYTMPKDVDLIELPKDGESFVVPINKNYVHQHAIIEIQGGHDYFIKNKCIYQPSKLSIQMNENLGILRVFKPNPDTENKSKPFVIAPGVYVKVYSKDKDNKVTFWKDGYTDLLGRFDYVTISSNSNILNISKFSILILFNDTMGEIKEVNPPKM